MIAPVRRSTDFGSVFGHLLAPRPRDGRHHAADIGPFKRFQLGLQLSDVSVRGRAIPRTPEGSGFRLASRKKAFLMPKRLPLALVLGAVLFLISIFAAARKSP